jgi:dienelactone hydrolase
VAVSSEPWFEFSPTGSEPRCGFIFYPGGRVDPRSYAPSAREIARNGILSVIVPMPLNHAVFSPSRASDVIAAYPEIDTWVIGGHSLGGSMAASYAAAHPDTIDGLVLWASYPPSGSDLSTLETAAVSIYGTLDGLIPIETYTDSLTRLPAGTRLLPIEGGNHAQFGWYGAQAGDHPATITRQDQQAQAIEATLDVFHSLGC